MSRKMLYLICGYKSIACNVLSFSCLFVFGNWQACPYCHSGMSLHSKLDNHVEFVAALFDG